MSIERGQAVVLVVGGALIGASVATLVLKQRYQKIADAEVASVKAAYKKKEQAFYESGITQEDIDKAHDIVTTIPDVVDLPSDVLPARTPYNKVQPSEDRRAEVNNLVSSLGYSSQEQAELRIKEAVLTEEEARQFNNEAPVPNIEPMSGDNRPYIISVDQFMANEEEYDQITLTYYEGDQQLTSDDDSLVDDVDGSIGRQHLHKFGEMSGNSDTVYVRNIERRADFEIIRDYRSFGKDMLGIDEPDIRIKDPKPPKPRKFRGE